MERKRLGPVTKQVPDTAHLSGPIYGFISRTEWYNSMNALKYEYMNWTGWHMSDETTHVTFLHIRQDRKHLLGRTNQNFKQS